MKQNDASTLKQPRAWRAPCWHQTSHLKRKMAASSSAYDATSYSGAPSRMRALSRAMSLRAVTLAYDIAVRARQHGAAPYAHKK